MKTILLWVIIYITYNLFVVNMWNELTQKICDIQKDRLTSMNVALDEMEGNGKFDTERYNKCSLGWFLTGNFPKRQEIKIGWGSYWMEYDINEETE